MIKSDCSWKQTSKLKPTTNAHQLPHTMTRTCLLTPQLVDLFRSYFEGTLDSGSVKRNFTLIYELLDEAMDFGFPQVRLYSSRPCFARSDA